MLARATIVPWRPALAALSLACACDAGGPPPPPPPPPSSGAATVAPSPAPTASAAPVVSSSAARPEAPAGLEGLWEGSFEAKRAAVPMPAGVKDAVRADDDPKANTGPGKISLRVAQDGAVSGTFEGALGKGSLSGAAGDEEADGATAPRVRAALTPDAPEGFSGFVVLERTKRGLEGTLHVSGPDAVRAREAALRLERKP